MKVIEEEDLDKSAKAFREIFGAILKNHAPVKIFQNRKNYAPWLSEETKQLMKKRNQLKIQSRTNNDPSILTQYKQWRNKIKNRLKYEKLNYYKNKFHNEKLDKKQVWKTTYEYLGNVKNLSPTQILINGNLSSSPKDIAEEFNNVFIDKVKNLKKSLQGPITIDPIERLKRWLHKRNDPIPIFELKPINKEDLKRLIKK